MKPTVFIHTNHKQMVGARVSAYSIVRNSPNRDRFAVEIIALSDFPTLHRHQGHAYLREGRQVLWDNEDLQSFTPLRFLPPQLMNFQGRAVVIDPDVFAVGDIYDLMTRDMGDNAILARRISPQDGRPPYYASSVMLLDCAKLRHWDWERQIEEMFAGTRDYRAWVSLFLEPENSIGQLEEAWNSFDALGPDTKLLHNTGRLSQPWKTGLPIDFTPRTLSGHQSRKWGVIPRSWIERVRRVLPGSASGRIYRRHPDPNQERFFFSLLRECLEQGILTEAALIAEIEKRHLRPDAFTVMDRLATG